MSELDIKESKKIRVTFCAYREWALRAIDNLADIPGIELVDVIKTPDEYNSIVIAYQRGYVDCIVFVGWSWIIKDETLEKFRCVGMHPSDLPYYRGGSPIQHQIINGVKATKISLMTISPEGVDTGDVWVKEHWDCSGRTMRTILDELTQSTNRLLIYFFEHYYTIIPEKQDLKLGSYYKRRRPEDSRTTWDELSKMSLGETYDLIRALGDPYPNIYIEDDAGNVLKIKEVEYIEKSAQNGD